jgi:hypothetical protein
MDQISGALLFANFAVIGSIMLALAKKAGAIRHPHFPAEKVLTLETSATTILCDKWLNQLWRRCCWKCSAQGELNNDLHKATSIDGWLYPFSRVLARKLPAPFGRKCSREKERSEEEFR